MSQKALRIVLGPLVALALFAVALRVIHRELTAIHLDDVLHEISGLGMTSIAMAVLGVILSYGALACIDILAFREVKPKLGAAAIVPAALAGYGFSNNIGFGLASGSAVRFQLLSSHDVDASEVIGGMLRVTIYFWHGVTWILGTLLLFGMVELQGVRATILSGAGAALLFMATSLLLFRTRLPESVVAGAVRVDLPSRGELLRGLPFSLIDWAGACLALYAFLPHHAVSFGRFLGLFVAAQVGAVASHVPGGLGVFESLLLLSLPNAGQAQVAAALVLFRITYYLLPFFAAASFLALRQSAKLLAAVTPIGSASLRLISKPVPQILAILSALSGLVLLTSGATPADQYRLEIVNTLLPLGIIEVSHFLGSVIGIVLIALSRGLWLRLREAYVATSVLLLSGIAASLFKGGDAEEALVLFSVLCMLLAARGRFYRHGPILRRALPTSVLLILTGAALSTVWLTFFAFKHTEYATELWWQFTYEGDASRSLRALFGAGLCFAALELFSLFSPRAVEPAKPTSDELDLAAAITKGSSTSSGYLALMGDKSLLFSADKTAFIMSAKEGRSLIALGDPIGPESEIRELTWEFRERADESALYPVFYQVGESYLPYYIDLGLSLSKLGEEAIIELNAFSLDGSKRRSLRHATRKIEGDGFSFEIVPAAQVPEILPSLKEVSDQWLTRKNVREKGFSLGRFAPEYLSRTPCAVIRKSGDIVAFSNVWITDSQLEFSIDLMRSADGTPNGIMEYLLVSLLLWGKAHGYRTFNFGMAPLAGLAEHRLAPLWHQAGSTLYRHGEHFYNFQGLREYKDKFDPIWRARYLAAPGGLAMLFVVADVSTLISGGVKGIFAK